MDFDGTITCRDSFIDSLLYCHSRWHVLLGLLLHSPLIAMMKLRLCDNGKTKQRVFSYFFKGADDVSFSAVMARYARSWHDIVRPKAAGHIRALLVQGHRVVVVSASLDAWMEPITADMGRELGGEIELICTKAEHRDGRLTGRFATPNCYGAEKVRRLEAVLPDRKEWKVIAYGDSKGDKQMFEYADETHYKPFR